MTCRRIDRLSRKSPKRPPEPRKSDKNTANKQQVRFFKLYFDFNVFSAENPKPPIIFGRISAPYKLSCYALVTCGQTSTGQEYLEFNERETKTRSGNDPLNIRAVPNNEKCPVKAYKVYAEKRPAEMKTDDAPFYLAVNNVKSGSGKP